MLFENEELTVRLLKPGTTHSATLCRIEGRRLEFQITPGAPCQIDLGALVEIVSPKHLYLGEVQGHRNERVIVHIEHAMDREAVERIGKSWHTGSV